MRSSPSSLLIVVLCAASVALRAQSGGASITASAAATTITTAHLAARILPCDAPAIDGGVLLERGGLIVAIGPRQQVSIPAGAVVVDHGSDWLCAGFVDLHHHVASGGGDINDMNMPLNPALRTLDTVKPSSELIRQTVSGGVTTTLFIPGSGTFMGGFGALLKMRGGGSLEAMVIRDLGAMKIAQGYNPERSAGDLGATRMGSSELLYQLLDRGRDYAAAWRAFRAGTGPAIALDAELEQLRQVFDKEVPVLIHTAGLRDCLSTQRMFQQRYDVRMILSHGCFDGWLAAEPLAIAKTPLNLGPRMYQFDRYGRMQGMCQAYWDAGCTNMSINTDAPVVAPEELQLQAAMAVRLGLPYEVALAAVTINPARQIGLDQRVGSLTVGKDADFQVTAGDPLDPQHGPKLVYIEGTLVHRGTDGR